MLPLDLCLELFSEPIDKFLRVLFSHHKLVDLCHLGSALISPHKLPPALATSVMPYAVSSQACQSLDMLLSLLCQALSLGM